MAESTLNLTYVQLQGEIGLYSGFGRGAALGDPTWSQQVSAMIESITHSGVRQFYYPPAIEGMDSAVDWSFLKPNASIDFANGTSIIPMPDDFAGFDGYITLVATESQVSWPIPLVSGARVRQQYAELPIAAGRPLIAGLEWLKGTTPVSSQRAQLIIFPVADQDYTLSFQYYLLPDCLTPAYPYVYGGMAHAETVLESCLAIAEERFDDASGVHAQKFMERLVASVSLDRRNKAQTLGYNADRSDRHMEWGRRDWLHWENLVKVGGVQY
jgi:hypothetical protein